MASIIVPKAFVECLAKLRDAEARKVKEAMVDAQLSGRIRLPPRPETRFNIPNIQKFGVSDGDRLVVHIAGQSPSNDEGSGVLALDLFALRCVSRFTILD
jgi:hypothetical protein